MVGMVSFSSFPPHIQPPMAQVPSAIRELTRFVPSILMYSSMVFLHVVGQRIRATGSTFLPNRRPITSVDCRGSPNAHVFPFAESPPKNLALLLHPIASH